MRSLITRLAWHRVAVGVLLGVGSVLRLRAYLSDRSLWIDECYIAVNIVGRGFAALLQPLDYGHAVPPAFLFLERAMVGLFGGSEYALRVVPVLAALCSMFIFWRLASALLRPVGAVIALAMFAISGPQIYYATEVKQYSLDVATSVVLWFAFLTLQPRVGEDRPTASVLAAALGAVAIWFSHPAVFVLGGIALYMLGEAVSRRAWKTAIVRGVVGLIWVGSFIALFIVTLHSVSENVDLRNTWRNAEAPFLPRSIEDLQWYYAAVWTLGLLPLDKRVSQLVLFAAVVGTVALWQRRHVQCCWFAGTFVLLWLASGLGKYPLTLRLWLFFAPAMILLVAAGADEVWSRTRQALPALGPMFVALLLALPMANAVGEALRPREHEEIRPILEHVRSAYRDGDILYLYSRALAAAQYYATRGLAFPGKMVLVDEAVYARDGEWWRGSGRGWFLFSHVVNTDDGLDEEMLLVRQLDRVGSRLDTKRKTGSSVYLYDFGRAPETSGARP
jgi:hypothetical protein